MQVIKSCFKMDHKKPYILAIIIEVIFAGMVVINKAALNHGMNPFVFIFYRQAAASLLLLPIAAIFERRNARSMSFMVLLKLFFCALIGITITFSLFNVGLKLTTATVAAASTNSVPVVAFCVALLLRMEVVKLRRPSGIAKVTGVGLCLAGALVIALYAGPSLSPLSHHQAFGGATRASVVSTTPTKAEWIKGAFLILLAVATWSVWAVLQAIVQKEFPHKMLVTVTQCVFSSVQSFIVAVIAERDFSMWKLRLDINLLAVAYCGFVVFGLSYYLQAWCLEMKGPVFLAVWSPFSFMLTIICSAFFLGEIVYLGSILGGILLCMGLYSMLWGQSKENKTAQGNAELNAINGAQTSLAQRKQKETVGREEQQDEATLASAAEHV